MDEHVDWETFDQLIGERGVVIDRPRGSAHPRYTKRIYPLNYGFIPDTIGGDGHPVDVFMGTATTGLVGTFITHDSHKGDDELKLCWNVTPEEIDELSDFLFVGGMAGRYIARLSIGTSDAARGQSSLES
jgi:inorganic pyrophosphatase